MQVCVLPNYPRFIVEAGAVLMQFGAPHAYRFTSYENAICRHLRARMSLTAANRTRYVVTRRLRNV